MSEAPGRAARVTDSRGTGVEQDENGASSHRTRLSVHLTPSRSEPVLRRRGSSLEVSMRSQSLVPVLLFALAGCGQASPSVQREAVIDSTGGSLAVEGGAATGARIDVPAGAVDGATRFSIATGLPDGLSAEVRAIGPMITFGPEGSRFAVPVHIVVPSRREPMVLLTRPHGSGAWTRVDGATWDPITGLVSADVLHFSDFLPVESDPGADGGTEPADASFCETSPRDPACTSVEPPQPGCDAIAQDCAAGQRCIPTDQDSGYDWGDGRPAYCVEAGTLAAGSRCNAQSECATGTVCVFQTMYDPGEGTIWFSQEASYLPMYESICMPICGSPNLGMDGLPSVTGTCSGADVCHPVQLWGFSGRHVNEDYGVCAPPPPGTPPRT